VKHLKALVEDDHELHDLIAENDEFGWYVRDATRWGTGGENSWRSDRGGWWCLIWTPVLPHTHTHQRAKSSHTNTTPCTKTKPT
jgi:hypothetical protein